MKFRIILSLLLCGIFGCEPSKREDSNKTEAIKNVSSSNRDNEELNKIISESKKLPLDTLFDTLFVEKAPKHFAEPFKGQKETDNKIKYTFSLNSIIDSSKIINYDDTVISDKTITLKHYQTYNTETGVSFYISDTLIIHRTFQPLLGINNKTELKRVEYNFQFAPWYTLKYYDKKKNISVIESDRDWNTFFVLDSSNNLIFKDNVNKDGRYMFLFDEKSNSFITNHSIYNINRNLNTELSTVHPTELLEYKNIDNKYMILIFKSLSSKIDNLYLLDFNFNLIKSENLPIMYRGGVINEFNEQNQLLIYSSVTDTLIAIQKNKPNSLQYIDYRKLQLYTEDFEYHEMLTFDGEKTYSKEYVYIDTINNVFRRSSYEFVGVD
ncbi:hypothetical protein [Marivirga arenosa]|uniref:Uncharacterized protein n=1 Tax=Marivirga arenosa TaxID=3059076 RepID=A0AA51X3J3_9BACT|nr:hypothetical protein [Marivirga sp. BKB1-2]WNB16787.1 hypothetical protein QYS47_31775 [Marivirga sp. BKB1-2]